MARAGETPTPEFQQGSELPYGAATAYNDLATPATEPQSAAPPEDGAQDPFLSSSTGSFLFGPTAHPDQPITAGAPFGEGPDFTPYAFENDDQFMLRVAQQFKSDPAAPPEVKAFAALVESGQ